MNQNRVQAGVPTGGQFAAGSKAESTDVLLAPHADGAASVEARVDDAVAHARALLGEYQEVQWTDAQQAELRELEWGAYRIGTVEAFAHRDELRAQRTAASAYLARMEGAPQVITPDMRSELAALDEVYRPAWDRSRWEAVTAMEARRGLPSTAGPEPADVTAADPEFYAEARRRIAELRLAERRQDAIDTIYLNPGTLEATRDAAEVSRGLNEIEQDSGTDAARAWMDARINDDAQHADERAHVTADVVRAGITQRVAEHNAHVAPDQRIDENVDWVMMNPHTGAVVVRDTETLEWKPAPDVFVAHWTEHDAAIDDDGDPDDEDGGTYYLYVGTQEADVDSGPGGNEDLRYLTKTGQATPFGYHAFWPKNETETPGSHFNAIFGPRPQRR